MPKNWMSCLILTALFATTANASVINYSSRYSAAGPLASGADYKNLIDGLASSAATAGYCDASLSSFANISNHGVCGGSNQNVAFHYQMLFGVAPAEAGSWAFRAGVDFGRGGAMFLDGNVIDLDASDLWWSGSYGNAADILAASGLNLASGNHVLDIYGLEGCCDGGQGAQFQIGNQQWQTFAVRDGRDSRVPVPATLALLGIGVVGLRAMRKR